MTTEAEYKTWLEDITAARCILVEAVAYNGASEETFYFSNRGYVSLPTDTPANTIYTACLNKSVKLSESLNFDVTPSVSFADIVIENLNGDRDDFIDYIWSGRVIDIYHGDMSWPRGDFYQVFSGKIDTLDSKKSGELILSVRDKTNELNIPIMETVLGGSTDNAEKILPVCFGEVANIQPLLESPTTHSYIVHHDAIEDILEVRDYGYPVEITKDIANGKFTLSSAPSGTITASVQGDKNSTYNTDIANIIKHIVKTYGTFTDSDINLTNFSAFSSANSDQVSCYYDQPKNILSIITELAESLGTKVYCNRLGELTLTQIALPPVESTIDILENDMILNSFSIQQILDIKPAIQLGVCKNHTVQLDLQTGIPELSKQLLADEWVIIKSTDQTLATLHKLDITDYQKDTALISKTNGQTESDRLLALWSDKRIIYSFTGYSKLMYLDIGQAVKIYNSDYGLSAGVEGIVIAVDVNWTDSIIKLEVLV